MKSSLISFASAFMVLLVSFSAEAGGGGCDGCVPPPTNPLVHCQVKSINTPARDLFEFDSYVTHLVDSLVPGADIELKGGEEKIYSGVITQSGGVTRTLYAYSRYDYVDAAHEAFSTVLHNAVSSGASLSDPRPHIMSAFLKIQKSRSSSLAPFQIAQRGYLNPADPWDSSEVEIANGMVECTPIQ